MSESLLVELNGGSVHAIEAPETFTASRPFHLELRNEGGAVHIHVHLSDGLARAARIEEANHYVGGDETVRVPVGTLPECTATGYLEIVSGYGAERERVEVTISSTPATDRADRETVDADRDPDPPDRAARAAAAPEHESTPTDRDTPGISPSARSDSSGTVAATAEPRSPGRQSVEGSEETASASTRGNSPTTEAPSASVRGDTAGVVGSRSPLTDPGMEEVGFAVLATVAVVVGAAVILVVRELVVSLVVAGVVTASVAAVGWLLFE